MSYVRSTLSTGERPLNTFRVHWMNYVLAAMTALVGVAMMFMGKALEVPALKLIALLFLLRAGYVWLSLRFLEQALTSRRVVLKRGIITRHTEEMRLDAIETVEIRQGVIGRLLDYGDVRITGRGVSVVVLAAIDTPLEVKRDIEDAIPSGTASQ